MEIGQGVERGEIPQSVEDPSPLIPIEEAARPLGVCAMTLRRAYHAGLIPGMRIGSTYRVSRAFVEALIAEVAAGRQVVFEEFAAEWLAKATEGAA